MQARSGGAWDREFTGRDTGTGDPAAADLNWTEVPFLETGFSPSLMMVVGLHAWVVSEKLL